MAGKNKNSDKKEKDVNGKAVAQNRRARFDYFIEETLEVGIMLQGSEVKSLRQGKVSIVEAHAAEKQGIFYLFNANISEYTGANRFNHEPKRPRQLLLRSREIRKPQMLPHCLRSS